MAWNEPGGSGDKDKNRDPWSNRPNPQGGPPDLDEVFKKLSKKLRGLFGGGRGSRGNGSAPRQSGGGGDDLIKSAVPIILAVLALWMLVDSIYFIDQAQRGVVTRFGKYIGMLEPGLNFQFPRPIDHVDKIDVSQVQRIPMQAQLLTKDLNLIRISLVVQYKINDNYKFDAHYLEQGTQRACPAAQVVAADIAQAGSQKEGPVRNYITDHAFAVYDPKTSLQESTESALREIVGGATMDEIISEGEGRDKLVTAIKEQIQKTVDKYRTGYMVTKVNLENVQPPDDVQKAFQDAVSAKEDQETLHKKAEAYTRDLLPKAEGDAERLIQEASAYREQVIRKADGEAQRFLQNLTEYRKAPEVTRKRMYLDTIEQLLKNSTKVVVKVNKGNNVMYLPIDRFINRDNANTSGTAAANNELKTIPEPTPAPAPSLPDSRTRSSDGRVR